MADEFTKTIVIGDGPVPYLHDWAKPTAPKPADNGRPPQPAVDNDDPNTYPGFEDTSWLT